MLGSGKFHFSRRSSASCAASCTSGSGSWAAILRKTGMTAGLPVLPRKAAVSPLRPGSSWNRRAVNSSMTVSKILRSYRGPTNMYGQPVLSVQPKPQDQSGQQPNDGLIPMAAQGLQSVGSYFWSYMPAPVRGVESPYTVAPGSGNVSVNFVPGSN